MNVSLPRQWRTVAYAILFAFLPFCVLQAASGGEPRITAVRLDGDQVRVTALIPSGLRKVTLESRLRSASGTWQPRAVARLDGTGGEVVFRVPRSERLEVLRIRADATEPLPAAFYEGTNRFGLQPVTSGSDFRFFGPEAGVDGGNDSTAPREVEESDLWKKRGDTLYVFNQYRGLQVIDIADPDQAAVRGTLDLPAAGDQMYLLGDSYAILLARDRCGWNGEGPESQIVIVDVGASPPSVAALLPVWGRISESRLVGTALYVASETSRPETNDSWVWGVRVTSFDLADPARPIERDALWFPGVGQAVAATPEFLFLATPETGANGGSTLHCLDITAPDGHLQAYARLPVFGRVADKFKMDWDNGILRVVSEGWIGTSSSTSSTRLETFRLPDPRSAGPVAPGWLGEVELIRGEQLFATRFDGPRAYVVTYRRIDPLWVVDLSDPAKPRVAGELQVPGWSTYIQPFGNRLVSVGIDDTDGRRAAVSLFDVTDPAQPALLKRVSLGEGWSWSTANYDEKAVTILADIGLILVPYVSWEATSTDGAASRVQLIDLDLAGGTLGLRGEIPHRFDAQRTALHGERVLSLSTSELLSVDVTDRDQPVIRHTLPLAWSIDRIHVVGDWVVEIGAGDYGSGPPALRIASAATPNDVRLCRPLDGNWPILTSSVRDGRLYVARGPVSWLTPTPVDPTTAPEPNLELLIYDLAELPNALPVVGEARLTVAPLGDWPTFSCLWVKPGLLVLAGGTTYYWNIWWGAPVAFDGLMFRYWSTDMEPGVSRLIALDVSQPATPEMRSDIDLTAADRLEFSPAFVAGNLVYLSHALLQAPGPIDNPTPGEPPLRPPEWFRVWRHQLDVVDYTDPGEPVFRKPVELPGRLQGVGAEGNVVYTVGPHWIANTNWGEYNYTEWLDASSYDGVAVHLIASLKRPDGWPRVLRVHRDVAWLGRPAAADSAKPALEAWALDGSGQFVRLAELTLPAPAERLSIFDTLLAAQSGFATHLIDIAQPAAPQLLTTFEPDGCVWYTLSGADGAPTRGLWIPAGMYGVLWAPLP